MDYEKDINVLFPTEWKMGEWGNKRLKPEEVFIRVRDPVEMLAYKLIDPQIMFEQKDSIKLHSRYTTKNDNGDICPGNLMSTKWAKDT